MRHSLRLILSLSALCLTAIPAFAAKDVPVPNSCTPQVNQGLQNLIASGTRKDVDNIMARGIASGKTRVQQGGPHGTHHVTTLKVQLPNGQSINIQVVANDALDGVVTANNGDTVFAFGQGYLTHGLWAAGIHDVHCSTHPTADNGWVVINGVKTPAHCPN